MLFFFSDEKILYLTPEQEKDKSHFTDKEASKTISTKYRWLIVYDLADFLILRSGDAPMAGTFSPE